MKAAVAHRMQSAAFVCVSILLFTGCSTSLRRTSHTLVDSPSSLSLREGPVNIEARLLADAAQQQARFGRVVNPQLFTSVMPVEITVKNFGHRTMTVRSADILLLLYGGHRFAPLDAAEVDARLRQSYDAMARAQSPVEYPLATAGMQSAGILCAVPNLLCLAPFAFTYVGGLVDTGWMAHERFERRLELRRAKATLATLLADVRSANRLVDATLNTGERSTVIVYFGIPADRFREAETAALVIRLTDTTSAQRSIVARLWLRGEPSAASY